MNSTEFALYIINGKRSRWKMTREAALNLDPKAEVVPGSEELRMCPETMEESMTLTFGHVQRGPIR